MFPVKLIGAIITRGISLLILSEGKLALGSMASGAV